MAYPVVRNAHQLGRIGELIAEAVFEECGYKCARVTQVGFDMVVFDEDGDSYRAEVKSSSATEDKAGHRYKFMTAKGSGSKHLYTEKDTDLMVFVALDLRRIVVKPIKDITRKRTTVLAGDFDASEAAQIRKAVAEVRRRRNS